MNMYSMKSSRFAQKMLFFSIVQLFISCIESNEIELNTGWTICNNQLYQTLYKTNTITRSTEFISSQPFFIRGANYAPTPIGQSSGIDHLTYDNIYTRDLKNLRSFHANTIKVYTYDVSAGDHKAYLDQAYNNGVDPVYTIFSIWIPASLMNENDQNQQYLDQLIKQYQLMAEQVGGHPGTLGFSIGGEINSHPEIYQEQFWKKFNRFSEAISIGLRKHSIKKLITTTLVDDGGITVQQGEKYKAMIDVWGINIYQRYIKRDFLTRYELIKTGKPLLVSEYGYSYATNTRGATNEEMEKVGKITHDQSKELEENADVIIGGFLFEYCDEWWKSGNIHQHDFGWIYDPNLPMQYYAEEWFGLYSVKRNTNPNAVDILSPRPIVQMLRELWGEKIVLPSAPECVKYSNSLPPSYIHPPIITTSSPMTTTSTPILKTYPPSIDCLVSPGDKLVGISSFYDIYCKHGGMGCERNLCRFCKMFDTQHSNHLIECPHTSNNDANDKGDNNKADNNDKSDINNNDNKVEPVDKPLCEAGEGNIRIGIGMEFDNACVINNGGLGCDMSRPGCKYCTLDKELNLIYPLCTNEPSKKTSPPLSSLNPTSKPIPTSATQNCKTSVGDQQVGVYMYYDPKCVQESGIGCLGSGCRFCKTQETKQSSHFLPCPFLDKDQEKLQENDKQENNRECKASIGDENVGISMRQDSSCLLKSGGLGCVKVKPGCRFCKKFHSLQSHHLISCYDPKLLHQDMKESSKTWGQAQQKSASSSSSTSNMVFLGIGAIALVTLSILIVFVSKKYKKSKKKKSKVLPSTPSSQNIPFGELKTPNENDNM